MSKNEQENKPQPYYAKANNEQLDYSGDANKVAVTRAITKQDVMASRNKTQYTSRNYIKSNSLNMTYNNLRGKDMVLSCLDIYKHVGIVRNIIDMISDFTVEGQDLIHPNRSVQNFWTKWLKMAKINDRSERLVNTVLKAGTCVVHKQNVKLTSKQKKEMKKGEATAANKAIPMVYTILNPRNFDVVGVEADGTPIVKISAAALSKTSRSNKDTLNNDPNNFICTYKKDDWELWAEPFHYAALDDLAFENKMQRMDEAAMDGVINAIRLWKLGGNLSDGTPIFPTPASTGKLATILSEDTGGGILDIIWDQFIDLEVEYPPVDKILGSQKYEHIRKKILEDFGIAQVLIDGSGQGSYSNQYLSVRSLIEKIEYLRGILRSWLEHEIAVITKAMGFRKAPKLVFKHVDLGNEEAKLALVMQLFDRGIISKDLMLSYFEQSWDVEKERIRQETQEEKNSEELKKVGPFTQPSDNSQKEEDQTEPPGKPGGDGRPPNQPGDKTQKKKRNTKPQGASVDLMAMVLDANVLQNSIEKVVSPKYLEKSGVKNVKQLTKDKKSELDYMKFRIFASCDRNTEVTDEYLKEFVASDVSELEKMTQSVYDRLTEKHRGKHGEPNAEQVRHIKNLAWATVRSNVWEA